MDAEKRILKELIRDRATSREPQQEIAQAPRCEVMQPIERAIVAGRVTIHREIELRVLRSFGVTFDGGAKQDIERAQNIKLSRMEVIAEPSFVGSPRRP
jgi:hypothetical protein